MNELVIITQVLYVLQNEAMKTENIEMLLKNLGLIRECYSDLGKFKRYLSICIC